MVASSLVVEGIKPSLSVLGDAQRFLFENNLIKFGFDSTFIPTSLTSLKMDFESRNFTLSGYRWRHNTTATEIAGSYSLNKFIGNDQVGTNIFTIGDDGNIVFNTIVNFSSILRLQHDLDANNFNIINLAAPLSLTDAVNKNYVDSAISSITLGGIDLTGDVTGTGDLDTPVATTLANSIARPAGQILTYPTTTLYPIGTFDFNITNTSVPLEFRQVYRNVSSSSGYYNFFTDDGVNDSFGVNRFASSGTDQIWSFDFTTGSSAINFYRHVNIVGTGSMTIPHGTTAERTGGLASIRYNTDTGFFEGQAAGVTWIPFDSTSGTVTSVGFATSSTGGLALTGTNPITSSGVVNINIHTNLEGLAGLSGATGGIIARTAAGTFTTRSLTQSAGRILITNSDGVSGNPTFDLDVTGVGAGSTTLSSITRDIYGRITAISSGAAVTSIAITGSTGLTVGGSPITTTGTITLTLGTELQGLSALSATGIIARTASGTYTSRTLTGTTNQIDITNGTGVSGNPTFSIPANSILPANVGIGATPHSLLQFNNTLSRRLFTLYEATNNIHQCYQLGVLSNEFVLQVDQTGSDFVFYAGTSSTTSVEAVRLTGNGAIKARKLYGNTANVPTVVLGAAAGGSGSYVITGNEISGTFQVTPSIGATTGLVATFTIAAMPSGTFGIHFSPANAATAAEMKTGMPLLYWASTSSTTFTLTSGVAGLSSAIVYLWNYHVIG